MTVFDMLVLGVLVLSAAVSLMRGLIAELLSLASWLTALVSARMFAVPFAEAAFPSVRPEALSVAAGFVLLFVAVWLVMKLLRSFLSAAADSAGLGGINRLLGCLFGLAKGVLLVTVAVSLCAFTDLPKTADWQLSLTAPYFEKLAWSAVPYLPEYWADKLPRSQF
ncbi:MAG: CvpA family protein [Neisseria sp.]|nr:CvpA family protein [Neisseria sp.]